MKMPASRIKAIEDALRQVILARTDKAELNVERILISDSVAGMDLAYYCPNYKVWDTTRAYILLIRRDDKNVG